MSVPAKTFISLRIDEGVLLLLFFVCLLTGILFGTAVCFTKEDEKKHFKSDFGVSGWDNLKGSLA